MPKDQPIRAQYQQHFITDQAQPMMQANAPVRAMYPNHPNGQVPIRGGYISGQRMYSPNQFVQIQPDVHQLNYQPHTAAYPMYNNASQYPQYQQLYQQQSYNQQQMYVLQTQRPGSHTSYVSPQGMPTQSAPHNLQGQRPVYHHQQVHHTPQSQQQIQQPHPQEQTVQPQKKRTAITLKDPTTGKDVTNEVFKKKEKTPQTPRQSAPVKMTAPTPPVDVDAKLKLNAAFAAQVASRAASQESPLKKTEDQIPSQTKETNKKIEEEIKENTVNDKNVLPEQQAQTDAINDPKTQETPTTENVDTKIETQETHKETEKAVETPTLKHEAVALDDVQDSKIVKETVEPSVTEITETQPEAIQADLEQNETNNALQGDSLISGLDDSNKSAFAVAKKKKKQRIKDLDNKQDDNDLLSAYTDAPQKEENKPNTEAVVLPVTTTQEDATWEDKEKTIDKEVIRNEDAEEPEAIQPQHPRTEPNIIVNEGDDDEKLQYDRDFLLKYQFAPICTSKPENLPDISDIVLNEPHPPTKALVPGQKISNNNFMPDFLRQPSGGGRASGGGRSKDRRGGGPSMSGKTPKIINAPQFEKVELKKSENAWQRPSEAAKELSEGDRERDELSRNVRAILNKLTPQKFKTLVDQMTALKVNTVEKLEMAIGIIFEKAISEPGFSVAYANMCRVLTNVFKQVPGDKSSSDKSANQFRKILLNKCQKEFEKEKQDDIQMEEDRNKTFDTEKEKKEWLVELDYRELKNRRRTLGNIRFIGELFKLKMISEKIMHECIIKLLRTTKPESMEDNLECLCKLLTTIGKDMDHQEAKPRIDQYFQQIRKIIEKRKISSRIKFALKDVIDLRKSNWVPRRDEGNPKTIDQIHREAEQKEKEEEIARQQEKLKRMEPRGRQGGRDSPSVRPNQSSDGWSVQGKAQRSFHTPVDASKFRIKKNESGDISLGPGGRPGAWSRGASGGSSSRSGSGSNTPTNEIEQKGNRFDVLSGSTDAPMDKGRGSRPNSAMRKGSQGNSLGSRRSDERSAALRAVRDATGQSSRNQSPARSGDSSRNSPVSGSQTPVEPSSLSPNPSSIDDETMRKKTKSTIEEFFGVNDYNEAILCIKELEVPHLHPVFIEEAVVVSTEKKATHRLSVGKLIAMMIKDKVISLDSLIQGITSLVELAPDLAVDIPLFYKYLGEVLGPLVANPKILRLKQVKDAIKPLIQFNKAGLVMAEALNTASQYINDENTMNLIWNESGIAWESLLDKGVDVIEFIKDKKVEYTMRNVSSANHSSKIQEELQRLLREKKDQKIVIEFIDENVPKEDRSSEGFIRALTYAVCHSVIDEKKCSCEKDVLKTRKNMLLRYIDGNKKLELQAAYALQNLAVEFNHPRGLLSDFFYELYECDIISEETFYAWETSKEFPDGKGVALGEVKGFLEWLKKAEEEQNDEGVSPTN